MVYNVVGLMSGSSLDGVDIACVHLHETSGKWQYELVAASCNEYSVQWKCRLLEAITLPANDYQLLHAHYGHYLGELVNRFIDDNCLQNQVTLIASHGHTTFHSPQHKMTHQIGDGAAIAAETGLAVVSDLRSLDIALGGEGAPIVPMGEKLLFNDYDLLLNLGGIANISAKNENSYTAFDVCSANKVLNMLSSLKGFEFDSNGIMARSGTVNEPLLAELNQLEYYKLPYPKSLANAFGSDTVFTLITKSRLAVPDALATYVEHVAMQIYFGVVSISKTFNTAPGNILITGGGAFNGFLISRIKKWFSGLNLDIVIPDAPIVKFKEAIIIALLGLLRWREEITVLSSVTGAKRDSIGGALWMGNN